MSRRKSEKKHRSKPVRIISSVATFIIILAVIFLGYVSYLSANAKRIADDLPLKIEKHTDAKPAAYLQEGTTYEAMTFNIGFGAYDHDFSFFLDENEVAGKKTIGTMSRAKDEANATENTELVCEEVSKISPDFALFQEVDKSADRSRGVDQVKAITNFWQKTSDSFYFTYAKNMHTGYLFYPPTKPIGKVESSGLLTIADYKLSSATRRSLPITNAFPAKFFDLDRCFAIDRLPIGSENGSSFGQLVLINVHTSAYDEGGKIRKQQMKMLKSIAEEEYKKGNFVIIGGDFNHALFDTLDAHLGDMIIPSWAQPFDSGFIPKGFSLVRPTNADKVFTCRDTSLPYEKDKNYEVTVDGFMVSANVTAVSTNINANFQGSDHNPVLLEFSLGES